VSEADVILLPGETTATAEPADVEHWIGVYTELVAFCQGEGITHTRFEQRLEHWLQLRNATATTASGQRRSTGSERPLLPGLCQAAFPRSSPDSQSSSSR
jgi:hypothetical protein